MSRPQFLTQHEYTGTNTLNTYTFDFKIVELKHLLVVVVDTVLNVELVRVRGDDISYLQSVTFDPINGGGTVVLKANLPALQRIGLILADDEPIQNFEFRNKTSFQLRTFEDAIDLLSGQIQSLVRKVRRSFRVHDLDSSSFNPVFPPGVTDAAGRLLQVNPDGTGFKYGPLASDVGGGESGGDFTGFSSRFNEDIDETGLRNAVLKIFKFTYATPLVSLSASGNFLREKGAVVTSSTLTANVTKRSNLISKIIFKKDGATIQTEDPASNTGSGSTSYNWSGSINDNSTFTVEVTDETTTEGGPTTVTSSASFNFVYPYYYGVGAAALDAVGIVANLTKAIIGSTATVNVTSSPAGQRYYFCYPSAYPALTSIMDPNNFETIADYLVRTVNITGLDGSSQSYRVYEFKFPTTQTNFTNSYRR